MSKKKSVAMAPAGPLTFETLTAAEIEDPLRADWSAMRSQTAAYRPPFFSHQFVEAVARFVPEVRVVVARRGSQTLAILPYQRHGSRAARPVGLGINDAHGLLTNADAEWQMAEFLQRSALTSFAFHAAPLALPGIANYELGRTRSFLADLTVDPLGYENYLRKTSATIDRQGQKTRRLIKEMGPLRFEFDCRAPEMLQRLLQLKSDQYARTYTFDIFSVRWIQQLLFQLHRQTSAAVRGVLSVLFAGQTPVALHFGLLEADLLHYWFPVFDPRYAYASPGTQLFLEVSRSAQERGIRAIDLGYGEQAYKHKLTNVVSEMSFGLISDNPLRRLAYRSKLQLRERLRGLPIKSMVKPLTRRLFPSLGKRVYE
ncbi:MAG: GNAT family N-acetyltransferase [Planctomycetales bacterium]|nr:GNAT family N-acetyltransferase [Planctomycetales bacterium]